MTCSLADPSDTCPDYAQEERDVWRAAHHLAAALYENLQTLCWPCNQAKGAK